MEARRPITPAFSAKAVALNSLVSFHEEVLELRGTRGTSCFRQRLCLARLVGLIFI